VWEGYFSVWAGFKRSHGFGGQGPLRGQEKGLGSLKGEQGFWKWETYATKERCLKNKAIRWLQGG